MARAPSLALWVWVSTLLAAPVLALAAGADSGAAVSDSAAASSSAADAPAPAHVHGQHGCGTSFAPPQADAEATALLAGADLDGVRNGTRSRSRREYPSMRVPVRFITSDEYKLTKEDLVKNLRVLRSAFYNQYCYKCKYERQTERMSKIDFHYHSMEVTTKPRWFRSCLQYASSLLPHCANTPSPLSSTPLSLSSCLPACLHATFVVDVAAALLAVLTC